MTPTTILIEREADAKVYEVIQAQYPEILWVGIQKERPTEWMPHTHCAERFPYPIHIKNNEIVNFHGTTGIIITAREWLAQHGYVWDGDGYRNNVLDLKEQDTQNSMRESQLIRMGFRRIGDGWVWPTDLNEGFHVSKLHLYLASDYHWSKKMAELKEAIEKHKNRLNPPVAPVSAPTRTEQREKELTERGYVKSETGYTRNGDTIGNSFIKESSDEYWSIILQHISAKPQPAPYTAGQEVEYGEDKVECATFDHEYNGIAYLKKLPHTNQLIAVPIDHIRPVQVQPEMPDLITQFQDKLNSMIELTPTGTLRVELTDLNILFNAIMAMRPLITPKQVTDEEIVDKWNEIRAREPKPSLATAVFEIVRWALQKAEGGHNGN